MRKGRLIGRIFATSLVFVVIGAAFGSLGIAFTPDTVEAGSTTFYPVADGYAWSGGTSNPSGGNSGVDYLRVGFSTASGNYRTLLKFDLSSIPAGAIITSADLQLYYSGYAGTVGAPLDISVYRTTANWIEGSLTWAKAENYDPFSYDTTTILGGGSAGYKAWDITSLVQHWIDGTYDNYGVLLRAPTQSGSSIWRTFRSKEYGSNAPKLEVTYTVAPSPNPSITNVVYDSKITLGEYTTIRIDATNNGGEASWQTIAISFPEDPSDVSIIDDDLDDSDIYWPGEIVNSSYGAGTVVLSYPLVEGVADPWPHAETNYLEVRVKPESTGPFVFNVKTVAGRYPDYQAVAWDPSSGAQDQQYEYVDQYTIQVESNPSPSITDVVYDSEIPLGEYAIIRVDVTNNGGEAAWQTIAISFSENPSDVSIIDHDGLDDSGIHWPGEIVNSGYGTGTVVLSYPLVEGVADPWPHAETNYLEVRVKPESTGPFVFNVKTVAGRYPDYQAVAWDPSSGAQDQQYEYVDQYTIQVESNPSPSITDVVYDSEIPLGEYAIIRVDVTNNGGEAAWQTIAISFPENPSDVSIIDHDGLDDSGIHWPGEIVNSGYGTGTVVLSYPLVEGVADPWPHAETNYLEVRVKPESTGPFVFNVKTVAGRYPDYQAVAWDPSSGAQDQQYEYVDQYTIPVIEVTTHPATDVTATSAILHGYLDSIGSEYIQTLPTLEPAELSLIYEADAPVASLNAFGIDGHAVLESALRLRRVTMAPWVGNPDGVEPGDEVLLDLFPDASYTATIDRVSVNTQGTVTVRGRLDECPASYLLMSTHEGWTLASVMIPSQERHYLILYEPQTDHHYLAQLDPARADALQCTPPLIPQPPNQEEEAEIAVLQSRVDEALGPADPAVVDVMIVYTQAAEEWADSGEGGIHNVIAQAIAEAELVLDNSNTGLSVRLVRSAKVDYQEGEDTCSTHLNRLREPDDTHMDEVHDWRDTYGADLVSLFAKIDDEGGRAYILTSQAGQPARAFSVVRVQQAQGALGDYTCIHEMGHNMGCHHHKEQNVEPGPTIWSDWAENTWSAGWRWTEQDSSRYCSVMTYEQGTYFDDGLTHSRVPYFSNPAISHPGEPTGHAADGDNARTIREIKHVIAAYRESVDTVLVSFEWWTDPEHKYETPPQPMNGPGPFSDDLDELIPSTTYHFRAKAAAGDVIDYGEVLSFPTTDAGALQVTIEPAETRDAGAQWRLTSGPDTSWKNSGETITDLSVGPYTVSFKDIAAWTKPPDTGVTINKDQTTILEELYTPDVGALQVTIAPAGARDAGAQWRLTSGPDTSWKNSGETITNLPVGPYTVTFKDIAGWPKPPDAGVTINKDQTTTLEGTYGGGDNTVDISVVLQGSSRPPEAWEVPITIKFFEPGADVMTDTPVYEFDLMTTKSDGTATCQCVGVMPGTYDITARASNYPGCIEGNCTLTNVKQSVVISAPSTAVDMGTLLAGDANCDGIINISDFGILAVAYMCTEGEPCYDCRADFDCNGIINISDFGLLAVKYMKMSPIDIS